MAYWNARSKERSARAVDQSCRNFLLEHWGVGMKCWIGWLEIWGAQSKCKMVNWSTLVANRIAEVVYLRVGVILEWLITFWEHQRAWEDCSVHALQDREGRGVRFRSGEVWTPFLARCILSWLQVKLLHLSVICNSSCCSSLTGSKPDMFGSNQDMQMSWKTPKP